MKNYTTWSSFCVKAAFFILLTISTVTFVQGQTTTFAQFFERFGTQDFVTTNTATSFNFQTIAGGSPVLFIYQNIPGLPLPLQGPQQAHIIVTGSTTTPAITIGAVDPPRVIQRFNQIITIQIIRDTPAGVGTGTQRNLLTAFISPEGLSQASLTGDELSDAAGFTASEARQSVVFTSDFLGFAPTSIENLGLAFSSINPQLSVGPGGFLNSFTAAGSGTFASTVVPIFNPPTAAGVTIEGRVFSAYGRPVSGAVVRLTDQNGETVTASTNSLGYFRFVDVTAGQTVVINVTAKGGTYEPRVFNLNDNIVDLNLYPVQ